ncbi:hypothetical protein QYM36_000275, partial [Artemia franciscana]
PLEENGNTVTSAKVSQMLDITNQSQFVMCLHFRLTLPLCKTLRSVDCNLVATFRHVKIVLSTVDYYLKGRKVKVRFGGTILNLTVFPERRITQGSALGPDMYNIGSYDILIKMKEGGGSIFVEDNTA